MKSLQSWPRALVLGMLLIVACIAYWQFTRSPTAKQHFVAFKYEWNERHGRNANKFLKLFLANPQDAAPVLVDEVANCGGTFWGVRYEPTAIELLQQLPEELVVKALDQRITDPMPVRSPNLSRSESLGSLFYAKAIVTNDPGDAEIAWKEAQSLGDSIVNNRIKSDCCRLSARFGVSEDCHRFGQ